MPVHLKDPKLQGVFNALRQCQPRGQQLADVLDRRGTTVRYTPRVAGGFTLNVINTIFLNPNQEFMYSVTLLAHEACHVEQGFIVDSIQQEIGAYRAQLEVADELPTDVKWLKTLLDNLDPQSENYLDAARQGILGLFAGQQAAMVYASLPLMQPTGLLAIVPALREVVALVRAGLEKPR